MNPEFYRKKRIFMTGHTGFKGMWLCKLLEIFGAEVTGYSLSAPTEEGAQAFRAAGIKHGMHFVVGDVRDYDALKKAFDEAKPEIVFHLAAQPIVRESYRDPVGTYSTNVMGTVHLLECVRQSDCVKSFLNVTTDKVYENKEWDWGYREFEALDGFDPYSNSKSCSELVTHSYKNSFLVARGVAVSTARAGNVIGGGDFASDRIIPDCVRAAYERKTIEVRNPYSIRPYQHVLEPLYAYLMIAQAQYENRGHADWYNVGPDDCDCITTGKLCDLFCEAWGDGQQWENKSDHGPHEAKFLKLDCTKMKSRFKWTPRWHIKTAVEKAVEWFKAWEKKENIEKLMEMQIHEFLREI